MPARTIYTTYTSKNYWYAPDEPIESLVIHGTAGGFAGSLSALLYGDVSASYLIDLAGVIYCLVNPYAGRRAWANGILQSPDMSIGWLAECVNKGINPNLRTISIEHVAASNDMVAHNQMPQAQQEASLWLCDKLLTDFKLPRNGQTVVGHYQITGRDRPNCPGVINVADWNRRLQAMANTSQTPPAGIAWQDDVTKFYVIEPFASFYRQKGGLELFGRPIGPMTKSDPRFPGVLIQNFERARFEQRDGQPIQLGLVNAELLKATGGKPA